MSYANHAVARPPLTIEGQHGGPGPALGVLADDLAPHERSTHHPHVVARPPRDSAPDCQQYRLAQYVTRWPVKALRPSQIHQRGQGLSATGCMIGYRPARAWWKCLRAMGLSPQLRPVRCPVAGVRPTAVAAAGWPRGAQGPFRPTGDICAAMPLGGPAGSVV